MKMCEEKLEFTGKSTLNRKRKSFFTKNGGNGERIRWMKYTLSSRRQRWKELLFCGLAIWIY